MIDIELSTLPKFSCLNSPLACRACEGRLPETMAPLGVVVPTRNRPSKLEKCLQALAVAREHIPFEVWVCDSSDQALIHQIIDVCQAFDFVHLTFHTGKNCAAARNVCAQFAQADVLINVDDDVYVESDAIFKLFSTYQQACGLRVVAGSVAWGDEWSTPIVMRRIGYGRPVKEDEQPDFFVGAFFLYPRTLALAKPWNEKIQSSDDRFMGSLLRAAKIQIIFEKKARAHHDDEHNIYSIDHQDAHIYANLFHALIATPRLDLALSFEVLGFLAGIKLALRQKATIPRFMRAWLKGHRDFFRDWQYLKGLVQRDV